MKKLEVIKYPNKLLKTISKDVTEFDEKLHALLDGMYDFMINTNGIGLAAIQVAHPINALVLNLPNENDEQLKEDLIEMINPVITAKAGTTIYQEGCLSVPGFYEDIERFETLSVTFQDREGKECSLDADGLLSIAIQHEIDHLQGKLFIEKLSYARRKKFEKEYKKAQKSKK